MFVQEPWLNGAEQKVNKGKKVGGDLLGKRKRGTEKRGQKIRMDSERWKELCVLRPQVRKQPLRSAVQWDPKSGNSLWGQLCTETPSQETSSVVSCVLRPQVRKQPLRSAAGRSGCWPVFDCSNFPVTVTVTVPHCAGTPGYCQPHRSSSLSVSYSERSWRTFLFQKGLECSSGW